MNTENPFLQNHRDGSRCQQKGDYRGARRYFKKNLDIPDPRLHAAALYHLAQMEADWTKKRDYLDKCLLYEPGHRMARVLLACLTPDAKQRLDADADGVIRPFFEQYPLNIQVQTISSCNGKCSMCPYHKSWHKKNPGHMSEKTFDHVIRLLHGIPLGKVCLYLENEPFLDHRLFQRIEKIKSELRFRNIEISTNVSLFNDKNLQLLVESLNDVDHEVWLSWHGITPERYKQLMGFDFMTNLEKLKNYFKITRGRLHTVINSIIGNKLLEDPSRSGKEETVSFFNTLLKESGITDLSKIRFKPFYYHDRAGSIRIDGTPDKNLRKLLGKLKPDCWRIKEWLHILYDGDIILCCMDYHKETAMGNVNDFKSLEELLKSEPFLEIQNQALGTATSEKNFICRRCLSPRG
jgi:MoaA/NifB/PqqE/SkfB family radical SAM enzyme